MSFIGNIPIFDYKNCEWSIFKGRLIQFLKVNNVKDDCKCAILITHLSDNSYRLVRNLAYPEELETQSFENLVLLLDSHFKPKQCSFADRAKFYSATRNCGESLGDWAARLRDLASYCDFGVALDTNLTDRFVLGLGPGPERDKLFEQNVSELKLARAIEIAEKAECARDAKAFVSDSVAVKEEAIYKLSYGSARRNYGGNGGGGSKNGGGGSKNGSVANSRAAWTSQASRDQCKYNHEIQCLVCGMKNHSEDKCRYKNYKCQKCGIKGHLKKMCNKKNKNEHVYVNQIGKNDSDSDTGCDECQNFNLRFQN
ncbi:uncharacterized protein LOC128201626 [Galleria mellonella]|uniref:Uncharacterized protein LOC128201626 n=1 Tax=Galleria mellonella TaxID=7137 RepID=A0ABM3MUV6_GALME|nr:uncharacterized protein LOC128201626 [Galleria mellonella]